MATIHQFVAPSPPFIWWGNQPDLTSDVIRLSDKVARLCTLLDRADAKNDWLDQEVARLEQEVVRLQAKLQALHDEFAAEARAYGNYEDDPFVSGVIAGKQEKAEDVRDRLAEILKEFA